jgi:hypothetical protein
MFQCQGDCAAQDNNAQMYVYNMKVGTVHWSGLGMVFVLAWSGPLCGADAHCKLTRLCCAAYIYFVCCAEMGYNHYCGRKGLKMPQTAALLAKCRPEGYVA